MWWDLIGVWVAEGRKERKERKWESSAFPDLLRFLAGYSPTDLFSTPNNSSSTSYY
jgi:hypothetical protein